MSQPTVHDLSKEEIHSKIYLLIENLCNIHDKQGRFLQHLPDGRIVDTKSWDTDTWEWTHGIGLYGIWNYFMLTKDPTIKNRVVSWFDKRFASGVQVDKNINTMSPMLTLACVYEESRDENYLPVLEEWAEWAMYAANRTECGGLQHDTYQGPSPQQLWDDTLMMTVMPLAKIGILLNRTEYIEESKAQFVLHCKYLFDPETGAFFHGWTFAGNHNFARARWARGNSWLTIAIPDFIELLDDAEADDEIKTVRGRLLGILEAQLDFLVKTQDQATGFWHTLLDHDDEDSYLESSATAGFAYGILKATRLGLCPEAKAGRYLEMAEAAVQGVLSNIDENGELQKTSFGTPMGSDLDFYRKIAITPMPYGQAMAIMAFSEYLQGTKEAHFIEHMAKG
jgi:unsaturated rhamnogalacturonyl hydrolase